VKKRVELINEAGEHVKDGGVTRIVIDRICNPLGSVDLGQRGRGEYKKEKREMGRRREGEKR